MRSLLYWEKENTKLGFSIKLHYLAKKANSSVSLNMGFIVSHKKDIEKKRSQQIKHIDCNVISY